MRKIEEQMNNAIRHRKNWSGSNTTVTCYKKDGITTEVNVLLHGHCIAWFDTASNDFNISSAGWETVTTKSRLNAILEEFASGARVIQRGVHPKELWKSCVRSIQSYHSNVSMMNQDVNQQDITRTVCKVSTWGCICDPIPL